MKQQELRLIGLFVVIDGLCKQKNIGARPGRGRKCGLVLSEILTIIIWFHLSGIQSFKKFCCGVNGGFLRPFFPKKPTYSAFLKQGQRCLPLFVELCKHAKSSGLFFIDSAPLPVCENVKSASHKTFKAIAGWAHSATKVTFGMKLHLVLNSIKKFVAFSLSPGKNHDVSCAENCYNNLKAK